MYRTVRHGENSLQYKILAQQEEGGTKGPWRKSKRGRTAAVVAVLLLLVCGVVASAVLVPLILADDFVTLTGTFQKFSVSTLRRTHSGNHVVVIAKKPHGWNASRQNVSQPNASRTLNASPSRSGEKEEMKSGIKPAINSTLNILNFASKTEKSDNGSKTSQMQSMTDSGDDVFKMKFGAPTTSDDGRDANTLSVSQVRSDASSQATSTESIASTTRVPSWHRRRGWMVESPASFAIWSKNIALEHPTSTVLAAFLMSGFVLIIIFLLMKKVSRKRSVIEDEMTDSKEDKTRLLKPSARGSDEE